MGQGAASDLKHVALLIEVPVIFTEDLDDLREYRGEFESESDWLLNCIRIDGGPVRLRVEISGEKDSEVVEVWGCVREAQLWSRVVATEAMSRISRTNS